MKRTRTILLLAALSGIAGALHAQKRYVNLAADFISPTDGTVIPNGGSVPRKFKVTNLGPDSVRVNDTLYVTGNALNISAGQAAIVPVTQAIPPNGAIQLQFTGLEQYDNTRTAGTDTTFNLCFGVYAKNAIDSSASVLVYDTLPGNNEKCISITLKGKTTGIFSAHSDKDYLKIYPNPASGNTNLVFNLEQSAAVTVRITDITGREVFRKEYGRMNAGAQNLPIGLPALAKGCYIAELQAGREKAMAKLYLR